MKIKHLYLLMALIGIAAPYSQFVPFLREHGLNLALIGEQMTANRISAFFTWDLAVSAIVLLIFIIYEARKQRIAHAWIAFAGSLFVGVSFGLPMFLYLREAHLERES